VEEIKASGDWSRRLEQLAGRRRESWILVAVVGVSVFGSYLLWGRTPPPKIAPPAQASINHTPTSGEVLLVHVAGAVRHPGLYEFPSGARVADAVTTAGGPTAAADLAGLNLAELLVDGTKIEVPRRGAAAAEASAAPSASPSAPTVDLNSADQAALETIPGVGPVTALAILQYRDTAGRFESFEQLLDVDGIGPATLEAIRPYMTI
jgi:competence protein ComEA